jgi:hypothetical protein
MVKPKDLRVTVRPKYLCVKTPVPVEDRGSDVAEKPAGWVPREKLYYDGAKEEDYLAHVLWLLDGFFIENDACDLLEDLLIEVELNTLGPDLGLLILGRILDTSVLPAW